MNLSYDRFADVDLSDPFFDSLKSDYIEFADWFKKKANDRAYVFRSENNEKIDGFLYLKTEAEAVLDVSPILAPAKRLKVGTLKINPHGTLLGERFIKKVFDHAVTQSVQQIYVTIFTKHAALVSLFERYGFYRAGAKTTPNGTELVLLKDLNESAGDILDRYPLVKMDQCRAFLLALYPEWHTRLLPDSILRTEDSSIIQDISHTNSIHKVYLAKMGNMNALRRGDILLIYRTTDKDGQAYYRSVVTSVCVVEEYRSISTFTSKDEFLQYCEPYSVFKPSELNNFWSSRKYPHVIRFTYNYALPRRPTRGELIDKVGISKNDYWGFKAISKEELRQILALGNLDENLVVD